MILTPLPTPDEDRFFSKTDGEGAGHGSSKFNTQAKDKSDTNHDHSEHAQDIPCLLYTSPSPRDGLLSRMPSSA